VLFRKANKSYLTVTLPGTKRRKNVATQKSRIGKCGTAKPSVMKIIWEYMFLKQYG